MAKYIITAPNQVEIRLHSDTTATHFVFYAVLGNQTLIWRECGRTDNPAQWIDDYADAYYALNALIAFSPVNEVSE